jgi:hypothetical protein
VQIEVGPGNEAFFSRCIQDQVKRMVRAVADHQHLTGRVDDFGGHGVGRIDLKDSGDDRPGFAGEPTSSASAASWSTT